MSTMDRSAISSGRDDPAVTRLAPAAASIIAGSVAIAANTALLWLSDGAGLRTAHGGLLRFLLEGGRRVLGGSAPGAWWREDLMVLATRGWFQLAFHLVVGLLMALAYGLVLRPSVAFGGWRLGLACAGAVWVLNAAIVLPAIGEGFAGSRHLTLAEMAGFAAIHTVFFLLLGSLFERLCPASHVLRGD